ncbi:MAG: GNAT family N-acetyltransferase [Dysgonamonadaceae bacterium]|jgi:GNAT superfamily N-acetyltransferase|nr:GNAT family N-acetyltransferase [Dysgonamonadaceae bacterium]
MIQYSASSYKNDLKALWKLCFPEDTDRFIQFYFDTVYQDDETLIYPENHRPIAALQMIPYAIKTGDSVRKGGYLSGIMTHPAFRKRGCMDALLKTAFDEMVKKGYDYAFLIPQQKALVGMYARYGFRLCEPNPDPPVNQALKSPRQWAALRQDFFAENGVWLEQEPFFPGEQKGMIRRLNPAVEEITTLYMGMMLD